MSHKPLPPPIGAIVCEKCSVLIAHITHDNTVTINGDPYVYKNPLKSCSVCGSKFTELTLDRYMEIGWVYKHKRGSRGY